MFRSIAHNITLANKEIQTVTDSAQKGPTTGIAAVRRQLRSHPSPSAGEENKGSLRGRLLPRRDEGTLRPPRASAAAGQEQFPGTSRSHRRRS